MDGLNPHMSPPPPTPKPTPPTKEYKERPHLSSVISEHSIPPGLTMPPGLSFDRTNMKKKILVLVTKYPTEKSKTRLASSGLNKKGALEFANALLDDAMEISSNDSFERVLYFAPSSAAAMFQMRCVKLKQDW